MKCLVHDCPNHSHEGSFTGELCNPCYYMLRSGFIGMGETFIHKINREANILARVNEMRAKIGLSAYK